ncbi:hypothetical protein MA16_Dca014654 [Dendrobium catenatum]|uniref:Uncharacterized protein n=1 Tax=Dendrobium catenatum TaxID=906689 RepID=A0A2I0WYT8_9ASPA|nr:hypothetical protein MA16_Dca014654 [Dendrobium catenatum]
MTRRSVRYAVVDAFTDTPFKGNPAAVCLLEEEVGVDDNWMQNVAKEFNISETAFLLPSNASSKPRFRLRWFTPVAEVELTSGKDLADIKPNFVELARCVGRGVIMTAPAPPGTGFDFFTRFFCPKMGVNEDPVCGSAHCALAPYWSRKLGKNNLIAYQASPRSGILDLQVDEERSRVLIRGEAVTVMEGFLMV